MIGFPKILATKQDYANAYLLFPAQGKAAYQALLDDYNRLIWYTTALLVDDGVEDETHRIATITDGNGDVTQRYQETLMRDPNCKLLRLGFTADEVEAIFAQIK